MSGPNPDGDGNAQLLNAAGNPIGIDTQRGSALFNVNSALLSRIFTFGKDGKIQSGCLPGEHYNALPDRANFGNVYGGTVGSSTFEKPTGYLGGSGATSNIPVAFQVQFGGRFSF